MWFFRKKRPASLAGFTEAQIAGPQAPKVSLGYSVEQSKLTIACSRLMPYLQAWGVLLVPFDRKLPCWIVKVPSLAQYDFYDRSPWITSNNGGGFTVQGGDIRVPWDVAADLIDSGLLVMMNAHGLPLQQAEAIRAERAPHLPIVEHKIGWKEARLDGTAAEFWRVRK